MVANLAYSGCDQYARRSGWINTIEKTLLKVTQNVTCETNPAPLSNHPTHLVFTPHVICRLRERKGVMNKVLSEQLLTDDNEALHVNARELHFFQLL